ncbi:hypothetical protein HpKG65_15250 [Helicobacter pylori]
METKEEDEDKKLEKIIVLLCEEGDLSSQKDQIIKDLKEIYKGDTGINTQKLQLLF